MRSRRNFAMIAGVLALVFSLPAHALLWPVSSGDSEGSSLPEPPGPIIPDFGSSRLPTSIAFFPPVAPPFGAPIVDHAPRPPGKPSAAPLELAEHVGEIFYAPLGTRLFDAELPARISARLKAYTATRDALVRELHDTLETLQLADAATREEKLRTLARAQAPRLAALEEDAEQLRHQLVRGNLLMLSVDWNRDRSWRVGKIASADPRVIAAGEYQVARAAAYYQDGLAVEQRWLLREIAMELHESILAKTGRPRSSEAIFTMFFSPGTGRFRLPEKIPPELEKEIGAYNGERASLKTELRETLFRLDAERSDGKRAAALQALSEKQWPRLAALEEKAELIRRGLETVPPETPPRLPPRIPPELLAQIEAYQRDRGAYEAERRAHAAKLPLRVASSPGGNADTIRKTVAALEQRRVAGSAEFDRQNAARLAQLQQRSDALRHALDAVAAIRVDPATGKPMDADALLLSHNSANAAFAALGRRETIYREYRIALLQPGLSPGQRRLLFAAVVAGLAQALPSGESLPQKDQRAPSVRL